jgi:hypothetical protein
MIRSTREEEEEAGRFLEQVASRIDPGIRVLLPSAAGSSAPGAFRFVLLREGHPVLFTLTAEEWRRAQAGSGLEQLVRRIGLAVGLEPPDLGRPSARPR